MDSDTIFAFFSESFLLSGDQKFKVTMRLYFFHLPDESVIFFMVNNFFEQRVICLPRFFHFAKHYPDGF